MHCFIFTLSLSAYPLPPNPSHAYVLQAVSMNPADYPYNRKSHNHIHRYVQLDECYKISLFIFLLLLLFLYLVLLLPVKVHIQSYYK